MLKKPTNGNFSMRCFKWHYRYLQWQVKTLITDKKQHPKKASQLLRKIFFISRLAINEKKSAIVYQMADLLKTAYGDGLLRKDEHCRLMNLCAAAMRSNETDAAGYMLDAYTPLIRQMNSCCRREILEQFILLTYIAKKMNQSYLLDKSAECIFEAIRRFPIQNIYDGTAVLSVLESLGLIAVKNRDYLLFRRIKTALLSVWHSKTALSISQEDAKQLDMQLVKFLMNMIYWILKRDYSEFFAEFRMMCFEFKAEFVEEEWVFAEFGYEAAEFSSMIAGNPATGCGKEFIAMLLSLAEEQPKMMPYAIKFSLRTARMSIEMHGLEDGFYLLEPALLEGRKLMEMVLKFENYRDILPYRYLTLITREFVLLAALMGRKFNQTPGSFIVSIDEHWSDRLERPQQSHAISQFCQLLLRKQITMHHTKRKPAQKEHLFLQANLFNEQEKKRLGI